MPKKQGLGFWVVFHRSKKGGQCRDAKQTQKLEELGFRWDTVKKTAKWEKEVGQQCNAEQAQKLEELELK